MVDFNAWDTSITFLILAIMFTRREINKTFTVKGKENFTTSHVLGATICLNPIPFLAEEFGDLSATSIPMLMDSILNQFKVGSSDGSSSDGNGQHFYYIAE